MKIFKGIMIGAVGTFIGEVGYTIYKDWKRSGLPFSEFIKEYKDLDKEWKLEDAKKLLKEEGLYEEPSSNDEILDLVKDSKDEVEDVNKKVTETVTAVVEEVNEKNEDKKEEK